MSSSRSDVVTQFVSSLVSNQGVVLSPERKGSFRGVSGKFKGCFKDVSRKVQGSFKKALQGFSLVLSRKSVSSNIDECFEGDLRVVLV